MISEGLANPLGTGKQSTNLHLRLVVQVESFKIVQDLRTGVTQHLFQARRKIAHVNAP